MRARIALLSLASLTASADALACGGFFCDNQARPIDQAGERIVFALDQANHKVEMHAQITYTGTAQEFAWILPVPQPPDLFLSTDELFTVLGRNTAPIFQLQRVFEDGCDTPNSGGGGGVDDSSDTGTTGGGVIVFSESTLGPYETVVLQGDSVQRVLDWLNEHDYNIPANVGDAMAPYVAADSWFVALRLSKDKTTGDLAPIGLTYDGDQPVIPLVLTSIAAAPDMPLVPYVFSSGRAVPDNYLHVVIDDLAIDWFNNGANYPAVVTAAADAAGGQAFATDFAGSPTVMDGQLYFDGRFDLPALRQLTLRSAFLQAILDQGFTLDTRLLGLLDSFIPGARDAITAGQDTGGSGFIDPGIDMCGIDPCPALVPGPIVDALDEQIVTPLRRAEELMTSYDWVTRLTSSMSAAEMTVDPRFTINPDMPEVAQTRTAVLTMPCEGGDLLGRLKVPDGRELDVPSQAWFDAHGMTQDEWFAPFLGYPASRIEQTSADAPPVTLVDRGGDIDGWIRSRNALLGASSGTGGKTGTCGCATGGLTGAFAPGLLIVAGMTLRRRRREHA